jgi:hypothetical protein
VALWKQQALAQDKSQSPIPESYFFDIASPFSVGYITQIRQHLQEIHRAIFLQSSFATYKAARLVQLDKSQQKERHHMFKTLVFKSCRSDTKTPAMF